MSKAPLGNLNPVTEEELAKAKQRDSNYYGDRGNGYRGGRSVAPRFPAGFHNAISNQQSGHAPPPPPQFMRPPPGPPRMPGPPPGMHTPMPVHPHAGSVAPPPPGFAPRYPAPPPSYPAPPPAAFGAPPMPMPMPPPMHASGFHHHQHPNAHAPPPSAASPVAFNMSQVQRLLNPVVGETQAALPLPPLAAPLPFAAPRDERFGPQWEGGKRAAKQRFEKQWVPYKSSFRRVSQAVLAALRAEGRAAAQSKVAELEAAWRAEDEEQAAQELEAAAARAAEFSTEAPVMDADAEAPAKPAPESLTAAILRISKSHEATRAKQRTAATRALDHAIVDNQHAEFGARLLREGLPQVKEALRAGTSEAAVAYALIRESRQHNVAPLLGGLIDLMAQPRVFVNAPLPTDESWLVHRACWDANPLVVKLLAERGAITSRLNEYGEHPLMVTHAAFTNAQPRCSLEAYNAIQALLAETYYRGLAAPAPPPASETTVIKRSGNPLWMQLLPTQTSAAQTHVFVSGIPFEYPVRSIMEWFANCGTIKHMFARRAGAGFAPAHQLGDAADPEAHTGTCVIVFDSAAAATKALEYDKYPLLRRVLHVTRSKPSLKDRLLWAFELAAAKAVEEGNPAPRRPTAAALAAAVATGRARAKRAKAKSAAAIVRRRTRELEAVAAARANAGTTAAEEADKAALGVTEPAAVEAPTEASAAAPAPPPAPLVVSDPPAWLATLPRGEAQRHLLLQGVPFEASADDVLQLLQARGSPPIQQVFLPMRPLKEGSAHDAKLCASLRLSAGALVSRGTATVLLPGPGSLVLGMAAWDGKEICGRAVRVVRRKADSKAVLEAVDTVAAAKRGSGRADKAMTRARGGRLAAAASSPTEAVLDTLAMSGYQQSKRRAEEEAEIVLARAGKRQRVEQAEEGEVGEDEFIL